MTEQHTPVGSLDGLVAPGSIPPPGTPFPAPPAPQDAAHDPEPGEPAPNHERTRREPDAGGEWLALDPRGAGRDLTLALRGIEQIDARLSSISIQIALGVTVTLGAALLLLAGLRGRAGR